MSFGIKIMKIYIEELNLYNYRNFKELKLVINNNIAIILGDNGSGKTNILESISLLSPGNGIRGAKHEEIAKNRAGDWSSSISMQSKLGSAQIKYSFLENTKTRNIDYNGSKITNSELLKLVNIIWLTPQMDGVFLSSASDKRRFLDRIVYNFYGEHATNLNKYAHLTSERLKILTNRNPTPEDDSWLHILEQKITDFAIKIINMRKESVRFLHEAIEHLDTAFPKAHLAISNLFEDELDDDQFAKAYKTILNKNRQKDAITKRTNFGINKQELIVEHSEKKQLAKFCSTGEQKALLISILLGQIEANIRVAKTTPILLLDELFVHLDDKRKDSLAQYLINSKLQTFITATDIAGLEKIAHIAQIIEI
jgi:DNA replication and repair protein RecF